MSLMSLPRSSHEGRANAISRRFLVFYAAVAVIQGVHVFEHTLQLVQVYAFGVPSEKAFGLLGYIFNFSGTAEWLHLVFNSSYAISLYVLAIGVTQLRRSGYISGRSLGVYLFLGVGLETWHMVEHVVIIKHVVHNHGCPCPGIVDQALNLSDVQVHFVYNSITYAAAIAPLYILWRTGKVSIGRRSISWVSD
jgi:hypothetical protein